MSNLLHINAFCDGACKGNPGPGGWGAYLVTSHQPKARRKELFGGEAHTTNNIMELTAVIEALTYILDRSLPEGMDGWEVNICVDSKYVLDGATKWINGWLRNKWRTSSGEPVKNKELWQKLHKLLQHTDLLVVKWTWIKGHSGHFGNEKADELANQGVDSVR